MNDYITTSTLDNNELPHSGPMRWIEHAALQPDGQVLATGTLAPGHASLRAGALLPAALIEWMAQAAAAGSALRARGSGRHLKRGYLVALRAFTLLAAPPVPAAARTGAQVKILGSHDRSFGPLSKGTFTAWVDGVEAARAQMTFHVEFE